LAARFEYFCGGGGGGGGIGEREPERSDIIYNSPFWHTTSDRIGCKEAESWMIVKGASGEGEIPEASNYYNYDMPITMPYVLCLITMYVLYYTSSHFLQV